MRQLKTLLLLSTVTAVGLAHAEPYCQRLGFDEEEPAGLTGKYELVGRDAATGSAYSGMLEITSRKGGYNVARTVRGETVKGDAWLEACGPDKYRMLRVSYEAPPKPMEFGCFLRGDGDNYMRATCTTADGRGLEAWFQVHESAAP